MREPQSNREGATERERDRERRGRQGGGRENRVATERPFSCPFSTTPWFRRKTKATYVRPAGRPWWHHPVLTGGVCRAGAGSGGTKLAFGANHFQSWLRRSGIRRVPPAGSPAKARWGNRPKARGVPLPSGVGPCTELSWRRPRPHFPTKNGQELFVLCPSFFKETLDRAPSQNSDDTQRLGEGEGSGGTGRGNHRSDYLPGWQDLGSRPSLVRGTQSWE